MSKNDLPASNPPQVEYKEESLKYLDAIPKATQHVSKAYDYAKDNSGPLKPSVETIEGTLKTIVSPVTDEFHDVPVHVLKFADRKIEESVTKAKSTSVASDIKNVGVVETASGLTKTAYKKIEPTAKEVVEKYEPVASSGWQSINNVPLFHSVVKAVVPTLAYVADKYNQTVKQARDEGYKDSSYLPLVPTEKIGKVFKVPETETEREPVVSSSGEKEAVVER